MIHSSRASFTRRAGWTGAACLLFLPLLLLGMTRALSRISNDTVQWTSGELPAKRDYLWFARTFEGQEIVFVSWEGCTRRDPRLPAFADAVRRDTGLAERVATTASIWSELAESEAEFEAVEIQARLQGYVLGANGRACALVILNEDAAGRAASNVRRLRQAALRAGVPSQDLHLAGNPVQVAGIDQASMETMLYLALPAAVAVTLAAWWFLRDAVLMLTVGALGGYCQAVGLAFVEWAGAPMNGMLIIMPLLVFVICVSSCVHLIHYHREAAREGLAWPAVAALARGWFPCSLAVATSALGVLSLSLSRIGPLRDFGVFTFLTLAVTLSLVLLVLPGVLAWRGSPSFGADKEPARLWAAASKFVNGYHFIISAICLAAAILTARGLWNIDASMGVYDLFSPTHHVITDYEWLQENVGPLLPAEIVIGFADDCPWDLHERLVLLDDLRRAFGKEHPASAVVSALNFTMLPIRGGGLRQVAARRVAARKLKQSLAELEKMNFIVHQDRHQLWRLTVRLPSEAGQDYSELSQRVQSTAQSVIESRFDEPPSWLELRFTGALLLAAESQRELFRSLVLSFGSSAVLITLTLILGLRDVKLGLLSVLPNFFPILVVFGGLGWLGVQLDMGALMTSCIGLGIAVDDTVHFLTWYRRGAAPRHGTLGSH